jgi:hypothetical protein
MVPSSILLLALLGAADPAEAADPVALPRIALPCQGPEDEIVVCGRRSVTEPYRIPAQLRDQPLASEHYSWSARSRDERETARYGNQAVGPGGVFDRSWQVDCEWRAERQALAGQMMDCAQRVRPRQDPE